MTAAVQPNMTIYGVSRPTAAIIIFTALTFLGLYAAGLIASPNLMAPWSCVAYLAVGSALWLAPNTSKVYVAAVRALGLTVVAIGVIVCAEYLAGAGPTTFDSLIFPPLFPRRPAAVAGLRFPLLGIMVFLAHATSKRLVLAREWTAVVVIILCYLG